VYACVRVHNHIHAHTHWRKQKDVRECYYTTRILFYIYTLFLYHTQTPNARLHASIGSPVCSHAHARAVAPPAAGATEG
jgi:hypothetical protein